MTKSQFCRFPYLTLAGRSSDVGILYAVSLRIQVLERLEDFIMYYAIGVSESSLHRESTDSLIDTIK